MSNKPGRAKGTRRIRVWQGGKEHERIVVGSKTDGDIFEARLLLELRSKGKALNSTTRTAPRFSELCVEYGEDARKPGRLGKKTWNSRKHELANLMSFFGEKKITEFTAGDIDAYQDFRLTKQPGFVDQRTKKPRVRKPAKPSVVNGEIVKLGTVLAYAKRKGYQLEIPPLRYLKQDEPRVRLWSREELDRLMTVTSRQNPQMLLMILYLLNTGCRKGEAIAAEWGWIDFKRDMLRIPVTEFWKPKNQRAREVPLSDVLLRELRPLKLEGLSEQYIFVNRDGVRFATFPDAVFKELQNAAGISGGPHTLRHCYASNFLETTPDLFLLSQVLGHSHASTTALYSHLLPTHLEKARNAVNIGPPLRLVHAGERRRASKAPRV